MTRATIAYEIAARIDNQHRHPCGTIPLGRSGYRCTVCGEFVVDITPGHARRCGFVNKAAMVQAGVLKRFAWGKERKIKHE